MKDRYTRLAASDAEATQSATDANTFGFTFSNEKVGRDGHVVRNNGIQTDNYRRNPVVLWAHDDTQPPIGAGSNISTAGPNARLDVTFVGRDILPFAGTIRDLVAGKWLRALSMSWAPLKWSYSTDPTRPGGMDFSKVDLLEVSVVPLPALPDALADARSRGINLAPLAQWAEQALDMRMYRSLDRWQIKNIYRAACGSTRLARARDLLHQISDKDRKIYERYTQLRDGYGFTTDQAAWDIGVDPATLRQTVARVLKGCA